MAPSSEAYEPGLQKSHMLDLDTLATCPVGHCLHCGSPATSANVPGLQSAQSSSPFPAVPIGQGVISLQALWLSLGFCPSLHGLQLSDPGGETCCDGHFVHSEALGPLKVPGGQMEQIPLSPEAVPAWHGTHSVLSEFAS